MVEVYDVLVHAEFHVVPIKLQNCFSLLGGTYYLIKKRKANLTRILRSSETQTRSY